MPAYLPSSRIHRMSTMERLRRTASRSPCRRARTGGMAGMTAPRHWPTLPFLPNVRIVCGRPGPRRPPPPGYPGGGCLDFHHPHTQQETSPTPPPPENRPPSPPSPWAATHHRLHHETSSYSVLDSVRGVLAGGGGAGGPFPSPPTPSTPGVTAV